MSHPHDPKKLYRVNYTLVKTQERRTIYIVSSGELGAGVVIADQNVEPEHVLNSATLIGEAFVGP